jgi:6-pyruvoyl-tetrahydropterin synthase
MSEGFEIGVRASVRAVHRMPGATGPEAEPHEHEYRFDVRARRSELDANGMVCDLDVLRAVLQGALRQIDGRDLEAIRPEGFDAVTVEVLARWLHSELADTVADQGVELLSVRVWESDDAFGAYHGPPGTDRRG